MSQKKLVFPEFTAYPGSQTLRGYRTLDDEAVCFQHDIFYDKSRGVWTPVKKPCVVGEFFVRAAGESRSTGSPALVTRHEQNFHDAVPYGFQTHVIKAVDAKSEDLIWDGHPQRKYWVLVSELIHNFKARIEDPKDRIRNLTVRVLRPGFNTPVPEKAGALEPEIIPSSYGGW